MKLLLILCWVLGVSADVLHEDLRVNGCSDSDGEFMYTLEREEVWYADFSKGVGVEPQPDFIDPINYPGGYESAVAAQQICRSNLNVSRRGMKDLPLEKDSGMLQITRLTACPLEGEELTAPPAAR